MRTGLLVFFTVVHFFALPPAAARVQIMAHAGSDGQSGGSPRAKVGAASAGHFTQFGGRNIPWAQMARWAIAIARHEGVPLIAQELFGEIAGVLGVSSAFVAQNWGVIGPTLEQGTLFIAGRAAPFGAVNLLRLTPHLLLGLVCAGVISLAAFRAQMDQLAINTLDEARQWQMNEAQAQVFARRDRRDGFLLPAYRDSNDIIITGPSSARVAQENIQNYITAAFRARGNPTAVNIQNAESALLLVQRTARLPPSPALDW